MKLKLPRKQKDEIDHIETILYKGRVLRIPVDKKGNVPLWCIAQHYQQYGAEGDLDETAQKIIPKKCTPKDIAQWWANPASCDVQGVDTEDSEIYNMDGVPMAHRNAQRKIAVLADPEEQKRIRKILSESFTGEELETMAANGSFIIRAIENCGDATGCYYRRQDGVEIPIVVIEKKCTADGIVHEVVHHIRAVDRSRQGMLATAYPQEADGKLDQWKMALMSRKAKNRMLQQEERMTVAETVARTGVDPCQSGYYDTVDGMNARKAYLEDRRILTGTPPYVPDTEIPRLKGKQARDAVTKCYAYSNIARARIMEHRSDEDE